MVRTRQLIAHAIRPIDGARIATPAAVAFVGTELVVSVDCTGLLSPLQSLGLW